MNFGILFVSVVVAWVLNIITNYATEPKVAIIAGLSGFVFQIAGVYLCYNLITAAYSSYMQMRLR